MADDASSGSDGEVKAESKGKMTQRHKRELKELATTTTKMLASVSKIDKKKKAEVEAQVTALQQQMQKRHEAELAALAGGSGAAQSSTPTAAPAPAASSSVPAAAEPAQAKAKSKAAKKREAKEKEELERQARVKDEKANTVSARQVELDAIARRLVPLHLEIKEMPSDGDCLFAAVADQLSAASRAQKSSQTIKSLRALAASHIRAHKADFEPFLLAIDDGLGEDGIEGYCTRLETTKLWGGEVEIRALSESLRVPVVVYSADMAPHVVGGEADPLRVSFHKHYLSLGAHYNSVVPALGAEQP